MRLSSLALLLFACACGRPAVVATPSGMPVRSFEFTYAATVEGLEPGAVARIWIPRPRTDAHQTAEIVTEQIPGDVQHTVESRYGNAMTYTEATADENGEVPFSVTYRIARSAATVDNGELVTEADRAQFLGPSSLVPVGAPQVAALTTPAHGDESRLEAARRLYESVDAHVTYDKPAGGDWGRGDTLWVCDSAHGNCTDFHSLFLSMCRDEGIAARFEMGFPVSLDAPSDSIGGYHCWAWFDGGERWIGCDISEADKHPEKRDLLFGTLPADRVSFTMGRDIDLVPLQSADPINVFIYPHVEVDGQVHTNMSRSFAYAEVD